MLGRGLTRRCPHCGDRRAFFTRWWVRGERCRGCGLRWGRELEGFMLGAMAVAFILTGASLLVTMAIGIVLTYPDVALVPVLGSTVAVTLFVGILGYPISYTTWQAVDLWMRPPVEGDFGAEGARAIEG
ncbi:MAG: hypothetical protein ACKORC_05385 [Acidimicrobiia bacterium]